MAVLLLLNYSAHGHQQVLPLVANAAANTEDAGLENVYHIDKAYTQVLYILVHYLLTGGVALAHGIKGCASVDLLDISLGYFPQRGILRGLLHVHFCAFDKTGCRGIGLPAAKATAGAGPAVCNDNTVAQLSPGEITAGEDFSVDNNASADACAQGVTLVVNSAYRPYSAQQRVYDAQYQEYLAQGYSQQDARLLTESYVAVPGHSEHQTGLAIDLGAKREQIDFIRPDFPYTGPCGDFRRGAAGYGFILRYPEGKEDITGIGHEPWHFRYVGTPHAAIIQSRNMALEEYIDYLRQYPYRGEGLCFTADDGREARISYIEAGPEPVTLQLPEEASWSLSGNNADGFILTEWR